MPTENRYEELLKRLQKIEEATDDAVQKKKSASGLADRTKLAETTFKTVLDADVHQDNKAGRVLSAMAFLTAATTAVFREAYRPTVVTTTAQFKDKIAVNQTVTVASTDNNTVAVAPPDTIERSASTAQTQAVAPLINTGAKTAPVGITTATAGIPTAPPMGTYRTIAGYPTPLLFFCAYMFCTLIGSVLYFAALGPSLNLRLQGDKQRENRERSLSGKPAKTPSLIFFRDIAKMSEAEWHNLWDMNHADSDAGSLQKLLLENYVSEAHVIAEKALAKFEWMSVGSILFRISIFCLGLLAMSLLVDMNRQFVQAALLMIGGLCAAFAFDTLRRPSQFDRHRGRILAGVWSLVALSSLTAFVLVVLGILPV